MSVVLVLFHHQEERVCVCVCARSLTLAGAVGTRVVMLMPTPYAFSQALQQRLHTVSQSERLSQPPPKETPDECFEMPADPSKSFLALPRPHPSQYLNSKTNCDLSHHLSHPT